MNVWQFSFANFNISLNMLLLYPDGSLVKFPLCFGSKYWTRNKNVKIFKLLEMVTIIYYFSIGIQGSKKACFLLLFFSKCHHTSFLAYKDDLKHYNAGFSKAFLWYQYINISFTLFILYIVLFVFIYYFFLTFVLGLM